MHYLLFMFPVWLLYMLLTGNWALSNILTGLVLAGLVALLIRPQKRPFSWKRLPDALLASVIYLVRLLWDLLISGLQVARIVLTPSLPINGKSAADWLELCDPGGVKRVADADDWWQRPR